MISQGLKARQCRVSDFYWIWRARNNPKVRQASLDTTQISMPSHLLWLSGLWISNRKFCWVISLDLRPVFVVQATNNDGKVRWGGYGVNLETQPIGFGALLPILGIRLVSAMPNVSSIKIELKQENESTSKRYQEWGFRPRVEMTPTKHKVFEMSVEEALKFATNFSHSLPSYLKELAICFTGKAPMANK